MAYIITETCVDLKDKSCVDVCPVDCIIDGGTEDRMLYINPDECIDCGACVDPCPVAAIYPEDEVPPGRRNSSAGTSTSSRPTPTKPGGAPRSTRPTRRSERTRSKPPAIRPRAR